MSLNGIHGWCCKQSRMIRESCSTHTDTQIRKSPYFFFIFKMNCNSFKSSYSTWNLVPPRVIRLKYTLSLAASADAAYVRTIQMHQQPFVNTCWKYSASDIHITQFNNIFSSHRPFQYLLLLNIFTFISRKERKYYFKKERETS